MFDECFFGLASVSSIDVVFEESAALPGSSADISTPSEDVVTSTADSSTDVVISTDVATEVSTSNLEQITTVFEDVSTEVVSAPVEDISKNAESVSGNELLEFGTTSSTADYSSLVEVVTLADKHNVDLLSQIDIRLCAIIFLLLLFWSVDRIKKIVRGFEVRDKHNKSDL